MFQIDLNDNSWDKFTDPAWESRKSMHEMQIEGGLQSAFDKAIGTSRQNESVPRIVTRAIADMVPVENVPNKELAEILFGPNNLDDKRAVRNFRNSERTLKLSTACSYIQQLLYSKKIVPAEGGRLWYVSLVYASAMAVISDYFRDNDNIGRAEFEQHQSDLISGGCVQFILYLDASLKKSSPLPLHGYPLNDVRQFMDYCAFVQWQEYKVKRNIMVSAMAMIKHSETLNEYKFD